MQMQVEEPSLETAEQSTRSQNSVQTSQPSRRRGEKKGKDPVGTPAKASTTTGDSSDTPVVTSTKSRQRKRALRDLEHGEKGPQRKVVSTPPEPDDEKEATPVEASKSTKTRRTSARVGLVERGKKRAKEPVHENGSESPEKPARKHGARTSTARQSARSRDGAATKGKGKLSESSTVNAKANAKIEVGRRGADTKRQANGSSETQAPATRRSLRRRQPEEPIDTDALYEAARTAIGSYAQKLISRDRASPSSPATAQPALQLDCIEGCKSFPGWTFAEFVSCHCLAYTRGLLRRMRELYEKGSDSELGDRLAGEAKRDTDMHADDSLAFELEVTDGDWLLAIEDSGLSLDKLGNDLVPPFVLSLPLVLDLVGRFVEPAGDLAGTCDIASHSRAFSSSVWIVESVFDLLLAMSSFVVGRTKLAGFDYRKLKLSVPYERLFDICRNLLEAELTSDSDHERSDCAVKSSSPGHSDPKPSFSMGFALTTLLKQGDEKLLKASTHCATGECPMRIDSLLQSALVIAGSKGCRTRPKVFSLLEVLIRTCRPKSADTADGEAAARSLHEDALRSVRAVFNQRPFWDGIAQVARRLRNDAVHISLIGSLLNDLTFVHGLLREENLAAQESLVAALVGLLEIVARDPLKGLDTHADSNSVTLFDVLHAFLRHATLQRLMVGGNDPGLRSRVIEALWVMTENVQGFLPQLVSAEVAEEFALDPMPGSPSTFGRHLDHSASDGEGQASDTDDETDRVNELRVMAFVATIVGFMCKSFDDGSWDPDHACMLRMVLTSPKKDSKRHVGAFFQRLVNLKYSLEKHAPSDVAQRSQSARAASDDHEELISDECRDRFMFVLEAVRQRLLSFQTDREVAGRRPSVEVVRRKSTSSIAQHADVKTQNTGSLSVSFPALDAMKDVRRAVVSEDGWIDFARQEGPLRFLQAEVDRTSTEMLMRCDKDYGADVPIDDLAKNRLKRNHFMEGTRELLDRRVYPTTCKCLRRTALSRRSENIGCSTDKCENRQTRVECNPRTCPAGETCENQRMQRMQYPKLKVMNAGAKGRGVVAGACIEAGALIGEYQGEVIDQTELERRKEQYRGELHFYFMSLTPRLYIDASRVSQITRFVNHSCDPNAETQKWNAAGEPRIGIFAKRTIARGEEITFDYGLEAVSSQSEGLVCLCEAKNCRGYLIKPAKSAEDHGELPEECGKMEAMARNEKIARAHRMRDAVKQMDTWVQAMANAAESATDISSLSDVQRRRFAAWRSVSSKRRSKLSHDAFLFGDGSTGRYDSDLHAEDVRIPRRVSSSPPNARAEDHRHSSIVEKRTPAVHTPLATALLPSRHASSTRPAADTKPAAAAAPTETARPAGATKPAAPARPNATARTAMTRSPAVLAKSRTAAKPAVLAKPRVTARPATAQGPASFAKSRMTANPAGSAKPNGTPEPARIPRRASVAKSRAAAKPTEMAEPNVTTGSATIPSPASTPKSGMAATPAVSAKPNATAGPATSPSQTHIASCRTAAKPAVLAEPNTAATSGTIPSPGSTTPSGKALQPVAPSKPDLGEAAAATSSSSVSTAKPRMAEKPVMKAVPMVPRKPQLSAFAPRKRTPMEKLLAMPIPVVRNRRVDSDAEDDSDSYAGLSVASPTVPVDEDEIPMIAPDLGTQTPGGADEGHDAKAVEDGVLREGDLWTHEQVHRVRQRDPDHAELRRSYSSDSLEDAKRGTGTRRPSDIATNTGLANGPAAWHPRSPDGETSGVHCHSDGRDPLQNDTHRFPTDTRKSFRCESGRKAAEDPFAPVAREFRPDGTQGGNDPLRAVERDGTCENDVHEDTVRSRALAIESLDRSPHCSRNENQEDWRHGPSWRARDVGGVLGVSNSGIEASRERGVVRSFRDISPQADLRRSPETDPYRLPQAVWRKSNSRAETNPDEYHSPRAADRYGRARESRDPYEEGFVNGRDPALSAPARPVDPLSRRTPGSPSTGGDRDYGTDPRSYLGSDPRDWVFPSAGSPRLPRRRASTPLGRTDSTHLEWQRHPASSRQNHRSGNDKSRAHPREGPESEDRACARSGLESDTWAHGSSPYRTSIPDTRNGHERLEHRRREHHIQARAQVPEEKPAQPGTHKIGRSPPNAPGYSRAVAQSPRGGKRVVDNTDPGKQSRTGHESSRRGLCQPAPAEEPMMLQSRKRPRVGNAAYDEKTSAERGPSSDAEVSRKKPRIVSPKSRGVAGGDFRARPEEPTSNGVAAATPGVARRSSSPQLDGVTHHVQSARVAGSVFSRLGSSSVECSTGRSLDNASPTRATEHAPDESGRSGDVGSDHARRRNVRVHESPNARALNTDHRWPEGRPAREHIGVVRGTAGDEPRPSNNGKRGNGAADEPVKNPQDLRTLLAGGSRSAGPPDRRDHPLGVASRSRGLLGSTSSGEGRIRRPNQRGHGRRHRQRGLRNSGSP